MGFKPSFWGDGSEAHAVPCEAGNARPVAEPSWRWDRTPVQAAIGGSEAAVSGRGRDECAVCWGGIRRSMADCGGQRTQNRCKHRMPRYHALFLFAEGRHVFEDVAQLGFGEEICEVWGHAGGRVVDGFDIGAADRSGCGAGNRGLDDEFGWGLLFEEAGNHFAVVEGE